MESTIYIATDKSKLDVPYIHNYLATKSYWAKGRTLEAVQQTIKHSLCFGVYKAENDQQIGFARISTDYVVFAWVMDVFIDPEERGKGYSKQLLDYMFSYPELQAVKGFGLRTYDAHELYKKYGFGDLMDPETWMYRNNVIIKNT